VIFDPGVEFNAVSSAAYKIVFQSYQ
jgi:hypothetical protein